MKLKYIFLIGVIVMFGMSFNNVFAEETGGLVPCGRDTTAEGDVGEACKICHLALGIHNIVTFIRNLVWFTAVLVITIAGVLYIVSAGNQSTTTMAKTAIKNALIGVVIVFAAYMIITFIMNRMFRNDQSAAQSTWTFTCN